MVFLHKGDFVDGGPRLSQPQHPRQLKSLWNFLWSFGNPGRCGWDTRAPFPSGCRLFRIVRITHVSARSALHFVPGGDAERGVPAIEFEFFMSFCVYSWLDFQR
jgi:hypothetical protein